MFNYIILGIGICLMIGNMLFTKEINNQMAKVWEIFTAKKKELDKEHERFHELEVFYKTHGDMIVSLFTSKEYEKRKEIDLLKTTLVQLVEWEYKKLKATLEANNKLGLTSTNCETDLKLLEGYLKVLKDLDIHYSLGLE